MLVFDCNVFVQALLDESSYSAQSLLKAKNNNSPILLSIPVQAEIIEVLLRPKFDRYVSKAIRLLYLEELERITTKIEITVNIKACRDPNDDKYLELALSGKADCIVTNDPDLLVLNPFENISILSPKDFLERF